MPTTTMRAGVVLPSFSRAMSPSVETKHSCATGRTQPVHHRNRLCSRAAVGFKPLRNKEPAAFQSRMLGGGDDGSFNAR